MNVRHSSRTDKWYTPDYLITMVRYVLVTIDLDPASDKKANVRIGASSIITKEQDGLLTHWGNNPGGIYLNPPGGKRGNRSVAQLFWDKLMANRHNIDHAIFMGFSLEQLQTTQRSEKSILDYPFCVPSSRIKFVSPSGEYSQPTHSNVICYVPGKTDRTDSFVNEFCTIGKVVEPCVTR